ncbi:unnamed protein product [Closterium sp. Naga37s-1]|nr:unnamed protein product [Closterium sp. Naga37s-1]
MCPRNTCCSCALPPLPLSPAQVSTVRGDWQAAYTAGPDQALTLFDSVHSKLITELDWQDMKARGVNTVRIPLPYWIAQEDPSFAFSSPAADTGSNSTSSNDSSSTPTATPGTPEFPYPPGALAHLDSAFEMAAKYGLRVWLSVHVAPGSQIGAAFSRDGLIRWSGLNVDHTLDFVRWIGDRFGGNPGLFGVGLLHEPVAPSYYGVLGVDGDELREYYRKAHDLIRERCACCFMSIEGRVGKSMWDVAFHMLDTWHPNVLYETHLYNVLSGVPVATRKLPQLVELEIGEQRSNKAMLLDGAQSIGRPIVVGEFGVAMASVGPTEEQQEFTLAQMQALGHAQAGWFFWSWKLNLGIAEAACTKVRNVLIVGAGISGVSAARHIAVTNGECFKVTVLEARNRVGGRMWSRTEPAPAAGVGSGGVIRGEMGAQWIQSATGNPITAIARRFKLKIVEQNGEEIQYRAGGSAYTSFQLKVASAKYDWALKRAKQIANNQDNDISMEKAFRAAGNFLNPYIQSRVAVDFEFEYSGELSTLSAWYYQDEAFDGPDLVVTNGYDNIPKMLMQGFRKSLSDGSVCGGGNVHGSVCMGVTVAVCSFLTLPQCSSSHSLASSLSL